MRELVALGVSLAVHGAVVLVAAARPEPARRGLPVELATVVEVFEAAAPPPARPRVDATSRASKPSRAAPVDAPMRHEAAAADVVAAAPEPEAEAEVAEPAEAPAAPAQPAPPARGVDVTALHGALADSARRCYPPAAKRYRLTGEATVDFCLDAAGAVASTRLVSSTGQSLLDDAARECVIAGALPLPLEAAGGCYQVPVRFGAR